MTPARRISGRPLRAGLLLLCLLMPAAAAAGQEASLAEAPWRLEIAPAAVAAGDMVLLGEVARPLGAIPAERWEGLKALALWPAPAGRGAQDIIGRERLAVLLARALGPLADLCMLPPQTVIQRGGAVLDAADLGRLVVTTLTPRVRAMDGEAELRDYRLPAYVFLDDPLDRLEVSLAGELKPGRLSLRLEVVAPDGQVRRRHTGQVFLDLWITAPVAARPLNRGDALDPDAVTHRRFNAAFLRDKVWDGRDFSLRLTSAVGTDQVLYASALETVPVVAKGDTVQLVYNGRYVRLCVSAEAMADGGPGDFIPVRNLQSRRQVVGRVRDAGTVEVN